MKFAIDLHLRGEGVPAEFEPAASVEVEADTPSRAMIQLVMQLPGEMADAWRERLERSEDEAEKAAIRVDITMASALDQRLNA